MSPKGQPQQPVADLKAQIQEQWVELHMYETFSPEKVRKERLRFGLAMDDYAKLLGVGVQTIHRWQNGKTRPHGKHIAKWFAAYGISRDEAWHRLRKLWQSEDSAHPAPQGKQSYMS